MGNPTTYEVPNGHGGTTYAIVNVNPSHGRQPGSPADGTGISVDVSGLQQASEYNREVFERVAKEITTQVKAAGDTDFSLHAQTIVGSDYHGYAVVSREYSQADAQKMVETAMANLGATPVPAPLTEIGDVARAGKENKR